MLFSAPDEVARTNAITLAPSATSASVRCEPMNPSAPVTRHVAVAIEVAELGPKRLVLSLGPGVGMVARHRWRIAPTPAGEPSAAAF